MATDFAFEEKARTEARERIASLHQYMVGPDLDDIEKLDDGTLDHVYAFEDITERYSEEPEEWELTSDFREMTYERFHESFLSIDFREAEDTHNGRAHYCLLISWGGPSEEIRVFAEGDFEFWYLDWFKGACGCRTIGADFSTNLTARWLDEIVENFAECDCFDWDRLAESNERHAMEREANDEALAEGDFE